jgi:hypothetical protein
VNPGQVQRLQIEGRRGLASQSQRRLQAGPRALLQVLVQRRLIAPRERVQLAVHHAQYQTVATRRLWGKTRPLALGR